MYTFITTNRSIQIRGVLSLQSVSDLTATINAEFKNATHIQIDLSKLQELSLSTVMKLAQVQKSYQSSGKAISFKGLENASVRGSFGLAGKRELLRVAA